MGTGIRWKVLQEGEMKLEKGNVFQYVEDGYSFTVTDVEVNIGNPIGVTVKVSVEYSDGTKMVDINDEDQE